jgi:hypothetical protein
MVLFATTIGEDKVVALPDAEICDLVDMEA